MILDFTEVAYSKMFAATCEIAKFLLPPVYLNVETTASNTNLFIYADLLLFFL